LSSCALSWTFSASVLSSWCSRVLTAGLCMSTDHKQEHARSVPKRALWHSVVGANPALADQHSLAQSASCKLSSAALLHQHHLQDSPA
jgi:hypothetical protein